MGVAATIFPTEGKVRLENAYERNCFEESGGGEKAGKIWWIGEGGTSNARWPLMPRAYLSALPRMRQTVTIRRIRARLWAPPHSYRSTQASISRTRYDSKVTREIVQGRDLFGVMSKKGKSPLRLKLGCSGSSKDQSPTQRPQQAGVVGRARGASQ